MKGNKYIDYSLVIVVCLFPFLLEAQRHLKTDAINAFNNSDFRTAEKLLIQYPKTNKNKKLLYLRGVSSYHCNHPNRAIHDLIESYKWGNDDREVYWYLAKSLQSQKRYIQAIKKYKRFLKSNPNEILRTEAIQNIKDCANGLRFRTSPKYGYVERYDFNTNSIKDETHPLFSVNNKDVIYYNSDKTGSPRIYKGHKVFPSIDILSADLKNEYKIEFFNLDGSSMTFTKLNQLGIQLSTQDFSFSNSSEQYYFNAPVNIDKGDKDFHFFRDSILLFASKRLQGYGGYDIYLTTVTNGEWTEPINLGDEINTDADEVSPFLCNDGLKIFYSSNCVEGFGGFDIYSSEYDINDHQWNTKVNLNSPINSYADDLSFQISSNGNWGLFSSNRNVSIGGFDIFYSKLSKPEINQNNKSNSIFDIPK